MTNTAQQLELELDDYQAELSPVLKWAGGKRWLVPRLAKIYADCGRPRLVEPFVGGMAVALALRPTRAILNDINPHLINFYRCLQSGLVSKLTMKNDSQCFYRHRSSFNRLIEQNKAEGPKAAALFYYLNRSCFNGLCRFNSSGRFNVPFGRYSKINFQRDFTDYSAQLSAWRFQCLDFAAIKLNRTDFIYADPPYDVEFTRYAQDDFVWNDQVRLANWLAQHRGPVVVSNQATQRVIDLYKKLDFRIYELAAPRRISCTGDRRKAREVLMLLNIPEA